MANYLDETGLGTLISLIKQWTLDEISASSGGGGGSLYVLPTATSSALGGIKIGYSANGKNYPVALDGEGRAYVNVPWTDPESPAEPYQLPAATASTLGGVKVGAGLSVEGDGTLSAPALDMQPITNEFIDGLFTSLQEAADS